jgi:hypothetical protein
MSEPVDVAMYNEVKKEVDKNYDKPSAYRSMAYTRTYIKKFKEKYGAKRNPYSGSKPGNLKVWRNEKWVDIKSFLENPKNPTACGNEPYKKGEYPLCMPEKKAATYSKEELQLLVARKNELGKRRLVKDAYLRDVLKPDEIPKSRIYKQKYIKDRRLKIPEPVAKKEAKKILEDEAAKTKVEKEVGPRGRPKVSEERKQEVYQAKLEKRKEERMAAREERSKVFAQRAAERELAKQERASERESAREIKRTMKQVEVEKMKEPKVSRSSGPVTIDFSKL